MQGELEAEGMQLNYPHESYAPCEIHLKYFIESIYLVVLDYVIVCSLLGAERC